MNSIKEMPQIMVVDDDENILKALRRELEAVNLYRVKTFKSPEAALIQAKNTQYDLLIADYWMPWMHGLTFIKKFTALQPHAASIIISGDAERAIQHSEYNGIRIPYLLRKPWQTSELLEIVADALSGHETYQAEIK